MKKIVLILISCCFLCNVFAQEGKDTIANVNNNQYFIGIKYGIGICWRRYKNIEDALIIKMARPMKNETPGKAYNYAINFGIKKNHLIYTYGIEYNYAQFNNNNASERIFVNPNSTNSSSYIFKYKYSFIHKFISIPISFEYLLGNQKNWMLGLNIKLGWMMEYYRTLTQTPVMFQGMHNKVFMKKNYPLIEAGINFSRKVIETRKINVIVGFNINYSTPVSINTVTVEEYPDNYTGVSPLYVNRFESKPHNLIIPCVQFSLQYKL